MKIDFLPVENKIITQKKIGSNLIVLFLVGSLFFIMGFLVRQLIIKDLEVAPVQEPNLEIKLEIPMPPLINQSLSLTDLVVDQKEVPIGAQVNISFKVINETNLLVTEPISVFIKGRTISVEHIFSEVSLLAKEHKGLSFYFLPGEIGEFTITARDQSLNFEVIDKLIPPVTLLEIPATPPTPLIPSLKVVAIDVPNQIFVNETISVTVAIENSTEEDLTEEIEIIIKGEKHSFEATVFAQATEIFVYQISFTDIGTFTVAIDDYQEVIRVIKAEPGVEIDSEEPIPQKIIPELDELAIVQLREEIIMDIIREASLSFVAVETKTTLGTISGSGFIVSSEGLIVTNRHVVIPDRTILEYRIIIDDEDQEIEFLAELVDYDSFQDLAVLQIKPGENQEKFFSFLTLGDSDLLRPGQTVIFIGNLLGRFPKSANVGVVAYLNRDIVVQDGLRGLTGLNNTIQITADVNHGNSGGPLLKLDGTVIGIVTAKGGNGGGIGFALPSNALKQSLQEIKQYGKIIHPFLGVVYEDLGLTFFRENNHQGFLIIRTEPNSPAYNKLKRNDIVIEINNQIIDRVFSLGEIIRRYNPGDKMDLTILRNNERMIIEDIILEERED